MKNPAQERYASKIKNKNLINMPVKKKNLIKIFGDTD